MNNSKILLGIILVLAGLFSFACSGNNPVTPIDKPLIQDLNLSGRESNRYLWGFYTITVDENFENAEINPVRDIASHFNVLKFLESVGCPNCVDIISVATNPSGTKTFGIRITHPFLSTNLMGFDVRGVAIFDASKTWTASGLTSADASSGDGVVVNADGYTNLYNPSTAGMGPGGLEGYLKGKLSSPTTPSSDINPYKRFISTKPVNPRNIFWSGEAVTADYEIDMPDTAFVFGYAVDACWAKPTVNPVVNPETDYPLEANCPEPWKLELSEYGTGLTTKGGDAELWVHVYDYQGKNSHAAPKIECPDLFNGEVALTYSSDAVDHSLWYAKIPNTKLPPPGKYQILLSVEDNDNASSPAHLNLTSYAIHTTTVTQDDGWARTWGGATADAAHSVAVDMDGDVLVCGTWESAIATPVDFDPTSTEDWHWNKGGLDAYVSKFDQYGHYLWTITFGGPGNDAALGIDVVGADIIRVVGYYSQTCDFDPDEINNVDKTSQGMTDAFVAQFHVDGTLNWVRTWGGVEDDAANAVTSTGSWIDALVVGYFRQTVDFDDSVGTLIKTSNGGFDAYMATFDNTGIILSSLVWGGTTDDSASGIDALYSGESYITGYYSGTVDFDPGAGTVYRNGFGLIDGYILVIDSSKTFSWAHTWGGPFFDEGRDVTLLSTGEVVIGGYFQGACDFNPQGAGDIHTAIGWSDASITWFQAGLYQWTKPIGGPGNEVVLSISSGTSDEIFAAGFFEGTVDFDPNVGIDDHTSTGLTDVFLTNQHSDGTYGWTSTLGSVNGLDSAFGVFAQADSSVYVAGAFFDLVDFDPGTGTDNHQSNGDSDAFVSKYFQDGIW